MQCEKCQAELQPNSVSCPECGAPVVQNVVGFENTITIQRQLKTMIKQHGTRLLVDAGQFTALLSDYIAEYEKERKLLLNMVNAGVLKGLIAEKNRELAIMNAKSYMLGEAFLSENATEFVLCCLTFMIGWPYDSPLRIKEPTGDEEEQKEEKKRPVSIDQQVFSPIDAVKFRFRANIVIEEGYTKIDSFAFDKFGILRTVQLPSTLLAIAEYAFSGCKHLRGVDLPESLKLIGQGAFSDCAKLALVKIPRGILEIADNTFTGCASLETVEIPDTVSSIGAEAFAGCERMRRLTLPESVKFIDKNAFAFCSRLTIRCIENSYVHKYCMVNRIETETVKHASEL